MRGGGVSDLQGENMAFFSDVSRKEHSEYFDSSDSKGRIGWKTRH